MPRTAVPLAPYRRFVPARALRVQADGNWQVANSLGTVIDTMPVLKGEWLVRDTERVFTEDAASFAVGFAEVPGRPGIYARHSPVEVLSPPLAGDAARSFEATHLRCGFDGRLFCRADQPIAEQLGALLPLAEHPEAFLHLSALQAMGHNVWIPDTAALRLVRHLADFSVSAMSACGVAPLWKPLGDEADSQALYQVISALTSAESDLIRVAEFPATASSVASVFVAWVRQELATVDLPVPLSLAHVAQRWRFDCRLHRGEAVDALVIEDANHLRVVAWAKACSQV